MKKYMLAPVIFIPLIVFLSFIAQGRALAQTSPDSLLDVIILSPGDSRSIEFEFDNTIGNPDSYHVALISAVSPDKEIHQLAVNISPRGDVGPEVAYFTWGIFFSFTGGVFDFIEMLDPKFTYGFNNVNYIVDTNPSMSVGLVFSTLTTVFSHFDFPLKMTMTLTLSN